MPNFDRLSRLFMLVILCIAALRGGAPDLQLTLVCALLLMDNLWPSDGGGPRHG